jgi:hypothetical protein
VEEHVSFFFLFFSIIDGFLGLVITKAGFVQTCEKVVGLLITDLPSLLATLYPCWRLPRIKLARQMHA